MPCSADACSRCSTCDSRCDDAVSELGPRLSGPAVGPPRCDVVSFHVSGDGADTFDAQLVRLIHGDTQPAGPGFKEIEVPLCGRRHLPAGHRAHPSRLLRADPGREQVWAPAISPCSLFAIVQPLIETGPQPLITVWDKAANAGVALVLEPGLRLALWLGGPAGIERVTLEDGLLGGVWYAVCGSWDPSVRLVTVRATPVVNSYNSRFGPLTEVKPLSATGDGSADRARRRASTCCWARSTPATDGSFAAPTTASCRCPCCVRARAVDVRVRGAVGERRPRLASPTGCAHGGT